MEYDADALFQSAALLASKGVQVVKLYGVRRDYTCACGRAECRTPGKHPAGGDQWQLRATVDEEEIASWFETVTENNRINIGIRLGRHSNIIDVEVDGPEAQAVLEEYGLHLVDTPTYRASRGEHRLFRYDQRLPDVGVVKVGELEVRIGGGDKASQSVAPCSWHGSGIQYQWLPSKSIDDIDPAPLPEGFLLAVINNSAKKGSGAVAKAAQAIVDRKKVTAGGRHAFLVGVASRYAARIRQFSDADRAELHELVAAFNDKYCDPPKEYAEFERLVNDQFNHYRDRREQVRNNRPFERYGLEWDEAAREYGPGSWKLILVKGDPAQYILKIPRLGGGGNHSVVLLTEDWQTPKKVAAAVQEQTHEIDLLDPNPSRWYATWSGERVREGDGWREVRGLRAKLFEERVVEEPTIEDLLYVSHANILLAYLHTLSKVEDDASPDASKPLHTGSPKWIRDEEEGWRLWFKWDALVANACKSRNVSLIGEGQKKALARAIRAAQGIDEWLDEKHVINGKSGRWIIWSEAEVDAIARMCGA